MDGRPGTLSTWDECVAWDKCTTWDGCVAWDECIIGMNMSLGTNASLGLNAPLGMSEPIILCVVIGSVEQSTACSTEDCGHPPMIEMDHLGYRSNTNMSALPVEYITNDYE
jgi:hypothetical protein